MSEWQDFNGFDERSFFGSFIHEMTLFFKLFALLFLGLFVFIIVKSVRIWISNNASPLIKANCTAVTKRTEVWGDPVNREQILAILLRLSLPMALDWSCR